MNLSPNEIARKIQRLNMRREVLWLQIEDLAKKYIPDYHFLDYKISTFWTCDESPIGMCLFRINDKGRIGCCRYCGGPVERK